MEINNRQPSAQPAPAFTVSEPLCAAYCNLFSRDFSTEEVKQMVSNNYGLDLEGLEEKLSSFHEGLSRNRLELSGRADDVSGWLLCYIEAYVDPEDVICAFTSWPTLTAAEVDEITAEAIRLSPILSAAWTAAALG